MMTLTERMRKVHAQRNVAILDEANLNELPAQIVFKRMTIRIFPDGRRVGEYRHEPTGVTIIYPMLFTKDGKK